MTTIDGESLRDALERYPEHAVFARVEEDRLETLPEAFRDDDYLWKDAEWVVRWYCRRPLDPHDRAAESAFRDNDMGAIRATIEGLEDDSGVVERIESLTALAGVDVPIASAFLQFADPENFTVIDRRCWNTLRRHDRLETSYPADPTGEDYARFLRECHGIAATADLRLVDVGRALWVLDVEHDSAVEPGRHR